jgi:hypothetical protein
LLLTIVASFVVLASTALIAMPHVPRASVQDRPTAAASEPAASAPPPIAPAHLYAVFASPSTGTSGGQEVTIALEDAGRVVLPTGRLVASDAMIITDAVPFTEVLPPGPHAVSVLRVDFADGDRRIAAAMIRVSTNEPVRWQLALVAGQDPAILGPDEVFGYGVDSGTGVFTSPEAVARLRDLRIFLDYSKAVNAGLSPDDRRFVPAVGIEVDRATGANVVAFESGFGDGAYPSFIGLDRDGRPAVVMTDFGILDDNQIGR